MEELVHDDHDNKQTGMGLKEQLRPLLPDPQATGRETETPICSNKATPPTHSQTVPVAGDQAFKHLSHKGHSHSNHNFIFYKINGLRKEQNSRQKVHVAAGVDGWRL